MTATGSPDASSAASRPDELREDIARTREQLGETVEALAAKADIKARAQQKAADTVGQVRQRARQAADRMPGPADKRSASLAAAALAVLLAVGWLLARRARRGR